MSSICNYSSLALSEARRYPYGLADNKGENDIIEAASTDDAKMTVCASEVVRFRAENWLLKQKLADCEIAVKNFEQLIAGIVDKQHDLLKEIYELREENAELNSQCRQQREYHAMERSALLKEMKTTQAYSNKSIQVLELELAFLKSIAAKHDDSMSTARGMSVGNDQQYSNAQFNQNNFSNNENESSDQSDQHSTTASASSESSSSSSIAYSSGSESDNEEAEIETEEETEEETEKETEKETEEETQSESETDLEPEDDESTDGYEEDSSMSSDTDID